MRGRGDRWETEPFSLEKLSHLQARIKRRFSGGKRLKPLPQQAEAAAKKKALRPSVERLGNS